jgi:hypothetical protein
MKSRGFGVRGLASPATFRPRRFSRPRRLAPRDPARAYFNPVTLLGFRLQGLVSSPGGRTSLEAACSHAVRIPSQRVAAPCGSAVFRAFLSPESPFRERPKPARGRCPPGVLPSKALPVSAVGPDYPTTTHPCGRGDGASDPSSPALPQGARVAPTPSRRFGVFPGGDLGVSSLSASCPACASTMH